jgi:hypothetical protein
MKKRKKLKRKLPDFKTVTAKQFLDEYLLLANELQRTCEKLRELRRLSEIGLHGLQRENRELKQQIINMEWTIRHLREPREGVIV